MAATWKQWEGHMVDGRFQLIQYLGGSDQSAVFLTQRGDHKAAIKLLSVDPQAAEQQLARWQAAATLSHPRLLPLYEKGRCQLGNSSLVYVVMEYADENLAQVVPQRPLTPGETTEMLPPVLDALAYLHGRGFAHAGVKPGNILAVQDQLKIASDNVRVLGDASTNGAGASVYDPPEAGTRRLSPASDVWSLGVTLVEVLTQARPAKASSNQEPVVSEGVPQPFRDIARHCLQTEPERRWTIADITARLRPMPTGRPTPTLSAEATVPAFGPPKSRYWIPVLVIALIVAAVVFATRPSTPNVPEAKPSNAERTAPIQPKPSAGSPAKGTAGSRNAREAGGSSDSAVIPPATRPVAPNNSAAGTALPGSSPASTAAPNPAVPTLREGHGAVEERVLPNVPASARNTIQGRIRVNVKVGVSPGGNVVRTALETPGPSEYFARLAQQAAQRWKFTPPLVNGQIASSEWMLQFQFKRNGTEVSPVQTSP
jgi:TonB family protein